MADPRRPLVDELDPHLAPEDRALLEEYLASQEALLQASQTGIISSYHPQSHQLPFHQSHCTNRWFVGANRTGKTRACYEEIRWFALGDHPYRTLPGPAKLIWVCCPTSELAMLYHWPGVIEAIGEQNIKDKKRGAVPRIELTNGCLIVFKFYAQGPSAFPSAGCDLIFCDEEPPWPVFEEMWSRRSSRQLNIIGANTMVKGFTWMYEKVIQKKLPSTEWFSAKLDDNAFIDPEERRLMKEGLKEDKTMYAIRVEGKIIPVGGSMRFDADALADMFKRGVREPLYRFDFDFDNGRWVQSEEGRLSIFEMPKEGEEYCSGVDVSEGLNVNYTDSEPLFDESSIQVLRRTNRRFVADYTAGDIEPADLGEYILPRLTSFYNDCWANIELNNHGHTVAAFAKRHMQSRLWSPTQDRASKRPMPHRRWGTQLSEKNRRFLVDTFAMRIHDRDVEIPSGMTLQQCMSFVRKSNGRVEHQDGMKDDRVMACGHALVCDRELPPARIIRPPTEAEKLRAEAFRPDPRERRIQWYRRIG